jgi:hypothetical protein
MGKPMSNDTVIYGQGHGVDLERVNWTTIEQVVANEIGNESMSGGISAAKKSVQDAQANPKLKNPYVKVGVAGKDLVFRIKDKGILKDTEIDTTLIRDYVRKREAHQTGQATPEGEADPAVVERVGKEVRDAIVANSAEPAMEQLSQAKAALKEHDYVLAALKVGAAASNIRKNLAAIRRPDKIIADALHHFGQGLDPRHIDPRQFDKKIKEIREGLDKAAKSLAQYEEAIEKLETQQPPPATTNGNANANYREKFDRILRANTAIMAQLRQYVAQGPGLETEAANIAKVAGKVTTGVQAANALTMASNLNHRIDQLLTDFMNTQFPMRAGEGESNTEDMTDEDKRKVFGPMNTKSMDLSGKLLGCKDALAELLVPVCRDLAERFPEHKQRAEEIVTGLYTKIEARKIS